MNSQALTWIPNIPWPMNDVDFKVGFNAHWHEKDCTLQMVASGMAAYYACVRMKVLHQTLFCIDTVAHFITETSNENQQTPG